MRIVHWAVLGVLAVAALTWSGVETAQAQSVPQQGIRVRGQGVVAAAPDLASVNLGVSSRGDTAGEAFTKSEERVSALLDVLRAAGVADRDIQTRALNLNPEYGRSTNTAPAPIVGWRSNYSVTVKLRDFATIGRVIDAAVRALGDEATVQGISFSIEDTTAVTKRAREAALANAKLAAEEIAGATGVRLGRPIYIEEVSTPAPTPIRQDLAAASGAGLAAAPAREAPIAPGEMTVLVIIDIVYSIE